MSPAPKAEAADELTQVVILPAEVFLQGCPLGLEFPDSLVRLRPRLADSFGYYGRVTADGPQLRHDVLEHRSFFSDIHTLIFHSPVSLVR